MNNTLLFSRFGKPENFRKLFAKEEEEEEEEIQRDSKFVKEYVEKLFVKVVKDCNELFLKMQVKGLLL